MLSFKATFHSPLSLSRGFLVPLHFLPSGWCHLHIWGYWYFSWQAILIPSCASSSPAFCMMYSACKLTKQGDNIQPWHTAFPIWYLHIKTSEIWSFPGGSDSKESTCNAGVLGSIPGLGRSPGGGHSNPLQYSWLKNPHGQRNLAGYSP